MSSVATFADRLQSVFVPTPDGVVGLVDRLLDLSREHGFGITYHDDTCHFQFLNKLSPSTVAIQVPKAVFRAVLARMAALCNQESRGTVSPYGGDGVIVQGTNPVESYRVVFANSPSDQTLQLTFLGEPCRRED